MSLKKKARLTDRSMVIGGTQFRMVTGRLKNHFPATSGAKFGPACGSPSHNPFHVVGMAQAGHFSEGLLPQTSAHLYLSFEKAVF